MKFNTKVIHAGIEPDASTGAVMTPIYQTSTYVQTAPGQHKGYEYARTQNPTRNVYQNQMAALESAKYGIAYASGLAAIDALAKLLKPGDEVISTNDLYGGTYRIFQQVFGQYGVKFHFTDMQEEENIAALINENTKMIWIETPTNPMINIVDIAGIVALVGDKDILTVVDNTFASPYLQQPIALGADIVVHSATKYIGGHSDVVSGIICTNHEQVNEQLMFIQNACGGVPGPMDCFLVLRGIKTLALRMQRHCENAERIADFLMKHDKVAHVYYPGLQHHKGHEIAKRQMKHAGGMLSFSLKNDSVEAAISFMQKADYFLLAESLGGVESLVGHPATMTHAAIPLEIRQKTGVLDSLIRLSVGVEDIDDLLEDIEQALS